MKTHSKLVSLLLALVLAVSLAPAALAAEVSTVKPDDKGSVTLTLKRDGNPVSGLNVALYRVGKAEVVGNNLQFVLLDEVKSTVAGEPEVSLNGLTAEEVKAAVATLTARIHALDEAAKAKVYIGTKTSDADGKAVFEDVEVGVYLAMQVNAGSYRFDPVLLFVPIMNEAGTAWDNAAEASPKVSYKGGNHPNPPTPPTPPENPPENPPTTPPSGGGESPVEIPDEEPPLALPQTGLLQWPIPVMAMAGVLLVTLGVMSERKRKSAE